MSIKSLFQRLKSWLDEPPMRLSEAAAMSAPAEPPASMSAAEKLKISYEALAKFASDEPEPVQHEIKPPVLMPGVVPAWAKTDEAYMALDAATTSIYEYATQNYFGNGFPGYPYLSELTQRSEYRSPSETTATEMTRKWIKVKSHGDGDLSEKIEIIEAELKRHKVRDLFRQAAEQDGFFGRAQIYIDIKGVTDESRKLPLVINPATIKKGSLLGFKTIEAIWTTPYAYNSDNPMAPDFFKPTSWFVLGKQTHATRLMTFVAREVPDMLKPAYNFGGMSMSQLMEPYVNSWLRTRDSVSDLLHSFSISGIKTNMSSVLSGGNGEDVLLRAKLFNQMRDNRGLMLMDKEEEEFFQFNTPLSSLDKLQAQAQEHMAAPSHTPLVKLLGITPTGLNANSDGEIAVYYDYIRAQQENLFTEPLNKILKIIQLDQFGVIDDAIGFEYQPLQELDGVALANVRKSDADAAVAYINAGVLSKEEERKRLASDPNSGYNGLEAEELPELDGDLDADPGDGLAHDSGFKEGDHPRDDDGKFSNGGNTSSGAGQKHGPFGQMFTEFHHDAKGAIAKLMQEKSGEAVGALHHPDIGDIDLVWGKEGTRASDGYGLAKLVRYHPEVLDDLQGILSSMKVVSRSANRVNLESEKHRAGVRLTWDDQAKHWLMTAFEKRVKGAADTSADIASITDADDTARRTGTQDDIVEQEMRSFYGASKFGA